jgi:hypothetical protein
MKVKPPILSHNIKQMITQKNTNIFATQTFSFGYDIRNIPQTTNRGATWLCCFLHVQASLKDSRLKMMSYQAWRH